MDDDNIVRLGVACMSMLNLTVRFLEKNRAIDRQAFATNVDQVAALTEDQQIAAMFRGFAGMLRDPTDHLARPAPREVPPEPPR